MQLWEPALVVGLGLILAITALRFQLLTKLGMLASMGLGLIIWMISGLKYLILILGFFCLGSLATRYRYRSKLNLRSYEHTRNHKNVLGNGLGPLIFCILSRMDPGFGLGYVAALASATGDTLATEIGTTSRNHPRLITNFSKVPAGTHGAISLRGEISGLGGALVISILGAGLGLIPPAAIPWATGIGFLGMHLDSLMGATLERMGLVNGHGVNLGSSSAAGFLAGFSFRIAS